MFIGFVSDEMHMAVPDVLLEFTNQERSVAARSRASGAVYADISPGTWTVSLHKQGYSSKRVHMTVETGRPYLFRLLTDRLYGYAWPKWSSAGEQAQIRVHSPGPYTLQLWRYGWEKKLAADFGFFQAFGPGGDRQILPDGDFTITGARWNEYGYAFPPDSRQFATAPDRTGLYYFHLSTLSGEFFSFPWIVAPKSPSAPIAVLASNNNWNAYNDFGGRSNYVAADRLPEKPSINSRQESPWFRPTGAFWWVSEDYAPLSFDRPEPLNVVEEDERITDPIRRIGAEHVAPAEWRLLGWLEREGFDYDLYSETQFHNGLLDPEKYRVIILSTHPEYWSRSMYERLKKRVFEGGGRLMYLGGNGINCEVEFPDEFTMVIRNGDLSDWLPRRSFSGEGALIPSRFGRRVEEEARLLGLSSTLTGAGTGAPYRVIDGSHWVFEGTGLRKDDLFGEYSLNMRCPGGASGHETDKRSPILPAKFNSWPKVSTRMKGEPR